MNLLNFLTNRKYGFLWGCILGSGGCLVFSKFGLIEAVIFAISYGCIAALYNLGSFRYLVDLLLRKNKQNTSKNPE